MQLHNRKFMEIWYVHSGITIGYCGIPQLLHLVTFNCTLSSVGWGWRGASYYPLCHFRCLLGAIHLGIASCLILLWYPKAKVHWKPEMRDVFVMSFALGKRVLFTIESIINVCFGDTPQTVILCPKIRIKNPSVTFGNFNTGFLQMFGNHPRGFCWIRKFVSLKTG